MKSIKLSCLTAIFSFFICSTLLAQGAHDANIKMSKDERPGLLITFPYSEGIVQNALRAVLERGGPGKPKSRKGFDFYEGVNWPEITPGTLDVYTKVEGKNNQSTILLLVSKGYDNYVSAASDAVMNAKLKAFLDGLITEIKAGQLQAEIWAQEDAIKLAEKEYKNADEEGNRLAREKDKLEKQIADNNGEKAKRAAALDDQRAKLGTLKGQGK